MSFQVDRKIYFVWIRVKSHNCFGFFDGSAWMQALLPDLPLNNEPRSLSLWVRSANGLQDGFVEHIGNWGATTANQAFGVMGYWEGQWAGYMHAADIKTGVSMEHIGQYSTDPADISGNCVTAWKLFTTPT